MDTELVKMKIVITCERETTLKDMIDRTTYEHFMQVFQIGYSCLNVHIERLSELPPSSAASIDNLR